MTEPRYCLMQGCRKFGTCQSPDNCMQSSARVVIAKQNAALAADVGRLRNEINQFRREVKRKTMRMFERKAGGS